MSTPKIESWMEAAAKDLRNTRIGEADLLMALFDTGAEDKATCEVVIKNQIAAIIARHAPAHPAGVAELVEALRELNEATILAIPPIPATRMTAARQQARAVLRKYYEAKT